MYHAEKKNITKTKTIKNRWDSPHLGSLHSTCPVYLLICAREKKEWISQPQEKNEKNKEDLGGGGSDCNICEPLAVQDFDVREHPTQTLV